MKNIKKIISPMFIGCGVSIVLYGTMNNLPITAYAINIPFWVMVVYPSGLFWRNKLLKSINEGQFPAEMKSYREMFVFSRKAVIYQLFLNQIIYHSLLGLCLIGFTYGTRMLYDGKVERKKLSKFSCDVIIDFFKLRALFGSVSLLSQFWGARIWLNKNSDGSAYLTSNVKRMLLMKEGILHIFWMASVIYLAHYHYPKLPIVKQQQSHPH